MGSWLIGRRSRAAVIVAGRRGFRASRIDPDQLERQAEEAERRGELEAALRLRFQAGLIRLDRAGALRYRADATTGEVSRALGSTTFDTLAETFDEVVYGERETLPGDVESARRDWPRVLEESKGR